MKYEITYPFGGSNKMWEPMDIIANLKVAKEFTILARTHTRTGCKLVLLDKEEKEMDTHFYTADQFGPEYYSKMAKDIAGSMNILLELSKCETRIEPKRLEPIMKEVLDKCESRYGAPLPFVKYEAKVMFREM